MRDHNHPGRRFHRHLDASEAGARYDRVLVDLWCRHPELSLNELQNRIEAKLGSSFPRGKNGVPRFQPHLQLAAILEREIRAGVR